MIRWSAFSSRLYFLHLFIPFSLFFFPFPVSKCERQQRCFARSVRNVIKRAEESRSVLRARVPRDCVGVKRTKTRREKDDCALLGAMNARETHVNPGRSFRECAPALLFAGPTRHELNCEVHAVLSRRQLQIGVAMHRGERDCRSMPNLQFVNKCYRKDIYLCVHIY